MHHGKLTHAAVFGGLAPLVLVAWLVACSQVLPQPPTLLEPGTTVRFAASDAQGTWADVTVTRGPDLPNANPADRFEEQVDHWVELEIEYQVVRDRDVPYAALVDWETYADHQGRMLAAGGIDWALRMPGRPTLPQELSGANAGDTVRGTIYARIFAVHDETWLAFVPISDRFEQLRPEWPMAHRWLIDN